MRRYLTHGRIGVHNTIIDYLILTDCYCGKWYLSSITNDLYLTTDFTHFIIDVVRDLQLNRPPYNIGGCNERGLLLK